MLTSRHRRARCNLAFFMQKHALEYSVSARPEHPCLDVSILRGIFVLGVSWENMQKTGI